ncbi:TraV family lipoprotein [Chromobacterium sp. IIBBL 290-4]|uniref:TraV family lipoprotein n=1 Tax=Chromobacterium sp. IIBBL 290-4 TaxID=2953890 RepID=UPI0020B6A4E1|nr:TraV family lipoprotein [Chromobacterium sp. IIBBL 290-4]UTH74239.1 TraV family lipoprotein [Chromobacterium sp. IIBBL 290-4]
MMDARFFFTFLVLFVVLSGCSSIGLGSGDFSCPGMPSGVVCKTPSAVYQMTEGSLGEGKDAARLGGGVFPRSALIPALAGPAPVLEPASVLRVWVAPYVDEASQLHWPGYVFTEVTPRQWSFGERSVAEIPLLTPLQVEQKANDIQNGAKE